MYARTTLNTLPNEIISLIVTELDALDDSSHTVLCENIGWGQPSPDIKSLRAVSRVFTVPCQKIVFACILLDIRHFSKWIVVPAADPEDDDEEILIQRSIDLRDRFADLIAEYPKLAGYVKKFGYSLQTDDGDYPKVCNVLEKLVNVTSVTIDAKRLVPAGQQRGEGEIFGATEWQTRPRHTKAMLSLVSRPKLHDLVLISVRLPSAILSRSLSLEHIHLIESSLCELVTVDGLFIETQSAQPALLKSLRLDHDAAISCKTWFSAQESHIKLSMIEDLEVDLNHPSLAASDDDRHLFGHLAALNELTIRAVSSNFEHVGMIIPCPLIYVPQTSYHSLTCCILHLTPYVAHTQVPAISIPNPFMGFFDNPGVKELGSLEYLCFSIQIQFDPEVDVKKVEWDPTYDAEWGKLDRILGSPIGQGGSYIAPKLEDFEMEVGVDWPNEKMDIGLQRRLRAAFNGLIDNHGLLEGMTNRFFQDDHLSSLQTSILGREVEQGVVVKDGDEYQSAVERCLREFEEAGEDEEGWEEDTIHRKKKGSSQDHDAAQQDRDVISEDMDSELYGYQERNQEDNEEIGESNSDSGEVDFDNFGYWGVAGPFDEDAVDDFEESDDECYD